MPHLRASFGHGAAAGFLSCQRASQRDFQAASEWKPLMIAVKFAPAESGRCTNSPPSSVKQEFLGDSGQFSQPATDSLMPWGRYCALSRRRALEEEHVKEVVPDWFETPREEPPRKMLRASNAEDEDNRDWSSRIRESLRQGNRLPHCDAVVDADSGAQSSLIESCRHLASQSQDETDMKSEDAEREDRSVADTDGLMTLTESFAPHLPSDPETHADIWLEPAFTASAEPMQVFSTDAKDQLSEVCPPTADSQMASASNDEGGLHALKSTPLQVSLPSFSDSPNPSPLIHSDCLPDTCGTDKLVADLSFPTTPLGEVTQPPRRVSGGYEEGARDRVVTAGPDFSFNWSATTCSHRKKRLHEARLRAKAKVHAHRVKLKVKDEEKPTTVERERNRAAASLRGDIPSLKSPPLGKRQGVLDTLKEGEEGITDDERLRIPRLSMSDEDGGNEFNSGIRREIKASCLQIAQSLLFDKVLTKTDTSGLGRIILPKRPAEQYLPHVPCKEGIEMEFEDCNGKVWKGRLRYWVNKSKMYVIEGAGGFLREHKLVLGDKILLCSSGFDNKLIFRYERGPFLPQTPCNIANPQAPTAPTREAPTPPPPRNIPDVCLVNPAPNPSSLPPFFSSSTPFPSRLLSGLSREPPHLSASAARASSPLSPASLSRTAHTPTSPRILNPTDTGLRSSPPPFVPAELRAQPAPFPSHPPNRQQCNPLASPFSSTGMGFSGGLAPEVGGGEGMHGFPAATSPAANDLACDILSDASPLATANDLEMLPRVRMKSGRLVPPLVVAALLQSARQLQRRAVRAAPSPRRQQSSPPVWSEAVEEDEGMERHVVPSYESKDFPFGASYLPRDKVERVVKGRALKTKGGEAGMSQAGQPQSLRGWDERSRPFTESTAEEGGSSMPHEWAGTMARAVFSNMEVENVGLCDTMRRAHYGEKMVGEMGMSSRTLGVSVGMGEVGMGENEICSFGDFTSLAPSSLAYGMVGNCGTGLVGTAYQATSNNHSEGGMCSVMDSGRSLDLATTESCLQLFGIDLPSVS